MTPETIQRINTLHAAGRAIEAERVLYESAKGMSNAELATVGGFTCPALIKAFIFSRSAYEEEADRDEISPAREAALAAVEKRIIALRRAQKQTAAHKAMTDAIERGVLTYAEARAGFYEPDPLHATCPLWFTCWSIGRQRELNKAAGLPYKHLIAL